MSDSVIAILRWACAEQPGDIVVVDADDLGPVRFVEVSSRCEFVRDAAIRA